MDSPTDSRPFHKVPNPSIDQRMGIKVKKWLEGDYIRHQRDVCTAIVARTTAENFEWTLHGNSTKQAIPLQLLKKSRSCSGRYVIAFQHSRQPGALKNYKVYKEKKTLPIEIQSYKGKYHTCPLGLPAADNWN